MWMYTDWRTGPRRFVLILGLFEVLCAARRHEEAGWRWRSIEYLWFSFLFYTDNDQSAWNWNWCTSMGGERGIVFSTRFDDNRFLTTLFRGSSQKEVWRMHCPWKSYDSGNVHFQILFLGIYDDYKQQKNENEIPIGKCLGLPVDIVAAALMLSSILFFTEKLKFFLRPYLLFNR